MKTKIVALATAAAVTLGGLSGAAHAGDAAKGEKVFKKCTACHKVEPGKHGIGPSLAGIFGKKAGEEVAWAEGDKPKRPYKFSSKLAESGLVWDEPTLDKWLENPKGLVKGTKMAFKLRKADQRADVIAYLKTLKYPQ